MSLSDIHIHYEARANCTLDRLTETYILVQGNTVAAMGSYKGLKTVRRIIEDTM